MKRFFNSVIRIRRWVSFLFLSVLLFIIALIILAFVRMLISAPANAYLRVDRTEAISFLIISPAAILLGAIASIYHWRSYYGALDQVSGLEQAKAELEEQLEVTAEKPTLSIRLYPEGFSDIDYDLVESLFRGCQKVLLYPLPGGFSKTLVFQVDYWDQQGKLKEPVVLKLGRYEKIKKEERNFIDFVEGSIRTVEMSKVVCEKGRGAMLFTYANMSRGQTITFEEFYSDTGCNTDYDVVAVIEEVFLNALQPWLDKAETKRRSRLYQTYNLAEDWGEIRQGVSTLGFDPDAYYFDFDCLEPKLPNPLRDAHKWFNRDKEFVTLETTVHGDLNTRNILIDGNRNVFVIDFAKTGRDHFLRDFCKLEAEIKFCLTRLHCDEDIKQAIALEKELLLAENGNPFTDLRNLLKVNAVENTDPRLERARRSIEALRGIASQAIGPQRAKPLAEQYYLGLLHYTLDTLRYKQCDRNSKLYALISASLLCRALR